MPKKIIERILNEEGIELFSFLSLGECKITKKYLLDRAGISEGSVIVMAVPYVSENLGEGNISEYAKPRDYHIFFSELFSRLISKLKKIFPEKLFAGFSDHSPIDERHAAALSGLGVIGKHGLLITEKYSSFVFIGELITDLILESNAAEICYCDDCGKCLSACPIFHDPSLQCLSALTQKKGKLTEKEKELIKSVGCVWGCDACQLACPHTRRAEKNGSLYTRQKFFLQDRLSTLTYRRISEMSDEEFSQRAYSWRGRETILRNLAITDGEPWEDSDCEKPNG